MKKNIVLHKAESRGYANHGWLKSHHSFSFASYYHPERIHFGALRVLNDDVVKGGMGFSKHPHDNMEIISIPLSGELEHKDSMGNTTVIKANDVQIMSAGTGVVHSEHNKNRDKNVEFLQIWVFPKTRNIKPRYDQKTFRPEDRLNRLQTVVDSKGEEGVLINQDARFLMGRFDRDLTFKHELMSNNHGLYAFVLEGSFEVEGYILNRRDALAISNLKSIEFKACEDAADILLLELPMSDF
jgi:quercetin 2,3-dioxygenase